jgi:hypothetical protein
VSCFGIVGEWDLEGEGNFLADTPDFISGLPGGNLGLFKEIALGRGRD